MAPSNLRIFFSESRLTVQPHDRYECLIRRLQETRKMTESARAQKTFARKHKYSLVGSDAYASEPVGVQQWQLNVHSDGYYLSSCSSDRVSEQGCAFKGLNIVRSKRHNCVIADTTEEYLEVSLQLPFCRVYVHFFVKITFRLDAALSESLLAKSSPAQSRALAFIQSSSEIDAAAYIVERIL